MRGGGTAQEAQTKDDREILPMRTVHARKLFLDDVRGWELKVQCTLHTLDGFSVDMGVYYEAHAAIEDCC